MACYSHKRATVLSKGPPKKKHTKGSREAAFGCFLRDERDYLATIAYVTVGCRVLITGDRVTAADASCSGTAIYECSGT